MAGGDADPNLARLLRRLAARGMDHLALLAGAAPSPRVVWRLAADGGLMVDGAAVRPAALFLRHDVFAHMADGGRPESRARAGRWYQAVLSWALAHEEVAFLNRGHGARQASKPHVLRLAERAGLAVPETLVTNDFEAFGPAEAAGWIVKPVNGGEHTRPLDEALADGAWRRRCSAEPVILQRRLVGPELRVYRVGGRWFAFALRSGALDYRTDPGVEVAVVPPPAALTAPLGRLMDGLGLDFGAADFKARPETGHPLFLEVNSAPMFAGFDRVARGALCDAILDWLAATAGRLRG